MAGGKEVGSFTVKDERGPVYPSHGVQGSMVWVWRRALGFGDLGGAPLGRACTIFLRRDVFWFDLVDVVVSLEVGFGFFSLGVLLKLPPPPRP